MWKNVYTLPTELLIQAEQWHGFSGKNALNAKEELWASHKKKAAKLTKKRTIMSVILAIMRKVMSKWKIA